MAGGIAVGVILGAAGTFLLLQNRIIGAKPDIDQPEVGLPATVIAKKISHLRSPNPHEKISAARSLGDMGRTAESAIPGLIEALDDDDHVTTRDELGDSHMHTVSREAGYALTKIGAKAVEPLIAYLAARRDAYGTGVAAEALGNLRARQATDILITVLKDTSTDYWPRMHAAEALGKIAELTDADVIEALIAVGDDEDSIVKNRAALALRKITDKDFGYDDPGEWKSWWEANKSRFVSE